MGPIHCCWHLWRNPAPGWYEGQQGHCGNQQGWRSPYFPGCRLWFGGRSVQGSARADREDLSFGNVGVSPKLQTYQCGGEKLSYHMSLIVSKSGWPGVSIISTISR